MVTIYGVARSRAFRCLWAAKEAGIEVEHLPVAFGSESRAPDYLALNPNGTVPAMRDGNLVLFESLAINLHLAAKAGPPLLPAGEDHSRVLQWTLWAATEIEPSIMQWARNAFLLPEAQRDAALAAAGRAMTDRRLAVLEVHLANRPFLLGEAFTIADCNLAGVLYGSWFQGYDLSAAPRVKAWMERCMTRPAALAARRLREEQA
ncbi:glutathione S-transferase family protein [Roseicella aquatilis]|uniref:Glutathione S-transferase family protein n=1 Tax=Roseicella aquatilis TaxID=2527868 RepID=A0A4R4DJ56_9PROT|nr:glutathione S-transferase family protein [Roseicella aquatilis]TCZ61296.1 glutathione S-transferase family protein [Roseicella aquatilis]